MKVFEVSEYLARLNSTLNEEAVVQGEVSGFSISNGKWVFFSLKDKSGDVLECFSILFRIKIPIADGMMVRVLGAPKIYEKSGRLRFSVTDIILQGEGSLKRAYLMLKNKLQEEGLFAPERKRALPRFPKKVALIASPESAAYGDFMRIFQNRWGISEIILCGVKVQGEGAAEEITRAFATLNLLDSVRDAEAPDAVVLIRGGGSLEDLAAFNDERVARAVFGSKFPVVVGVGHERDESLADFAADARASTPSNAAEILFPDKREVAAELDFAVQNWDQMLGSIISAAIRAVENLTAGLEERAMRSVRSGHEIIKKFMEAPDFILNEARVRAEEIGSFERILTGLNPRSLIKKGYSIVTSGGRIVKKIREVHKGACVDVEISDGSFAAKVV